MGKGTDRDRMGPTRGPRRLYDWTALRTRYIAADCSQAEFAEREGVTLSKLKARASAEGWNAAREAHRAKVAAKVEAKTVERKASAEAEIDAAAHRFALRAMAKAEAMLGNGDDGDDAEAKDGIEPRDLKAIVDAHRAAYEQARIAARLTPLPVVAVQEQGPADVDAREQLLGRLARLAAAGSPAGAGGEPVGAGSAGGAVPVAAVGATEAA